MTSSRNSAKSSRGRKEGDKITAHRGDFTLTRKTKDVLPLLPFARMKDVILGTSYDCSLVIVGDTLSRRLNEQYRHKNYTPNVLSFPLSPKSGEIFLNLKEARRQMRDPKGIPQTEELSFPHWVAKLVIHAMLHLKGMHHGGTMDSAEARYLGIFF